MASRTCISVFQSKHTGLWVAGFDKQTGMYQWSPLIQDAMLFYGWSSDGSFCARDYKREVVEVPKFHPPKPKVWKPKKPKKAKKKSENANTGDEK